MPSTKMLRIAPEVIDMDVSSHGAVNIAQHASGDSSGTYVVGVNKFPGGDFVLDVSGNIRCHSIQLDGGSIAGGGSGPWDVNEDNNKIYYNDGSVGVGTNDPNPTFQVDVSGALNCTQLYVDGELFTISGEDITTTGRWDKSGNRVYYDDNGAGGLVGINTSNPATALDVSGDITAHTIHIGTTGIIGGRRGTDISEITIWVGVNDASNDFVFYTDASATELLEIDEDGNKILYAGKTYTFITLESDFESNNQDIKFDVSWSGDGVSTSTDFDSVFGDGIYNFINGGIFFSGTLYVTIEDSFIDSSLNYRNNGIDDTIVINGSFSVIENRRILPIEADVDVSGIVSCDKLFIADTEFGTANLNKWIHDDTNNQLSYSDGDVVINNALMCENINLNTVDVGAGETIELWVGFMNNGSFLRSRYYASDAGTGYGVGCQFFTRDEYNIEYELYPFNTLYMNKRYVFHRLTNFVSGWPSRSGSGGYEGGSWANWEERHLLSYAVVIQSDNDVNGIFDISSDGINPTTGVDSGILGDQRIELSFNAVDTTRNLFIRNLGSGQKLYFNLVASDQGNGTLDISGDIKSHTSICENLRIPEYPVNSGEIVYIYLNCNAYLDDSTVWHLQYPYFEFYYMESAQGSLEHKLDTPPVLYLNKTYRFINNIWTSHGAGNPGLETFHFGISGDLSKYTITNIGAGVGATMAEFGNSHIFSGYQILELKFINMTESDSEDINALRYFATSSEGVGRSSRVDPTPDMSGAFRLEASELSPGSLDLSGDMNVTGNILLNGQDILSKLSPWDLCGNNNISYTDGYVGIGKDPTELLDVSGNIAADGINLNNIFGNMEGGTDTSHNIWVDISASSNRFLFYKDASRNTLFESDILYSDKQYTFKVLFDEGGVEDLGVGLRMVELGDASNTFFLDTTNVSNIVTLVNNDLLTTEGDGVYDRGIFNAKDDGLVNIDSGIINEGTYILDVSTNFTGDRILRFSDEGTAGTNISGEFILRENRSIVTAQTDVKVEGKMTVTRDVTLEGDLDVSGDFILGGVSLSTNITTQVNTQIAASSSWVKDTDIVYNTTDKIGIGTSSPNEALDVSGNVAIDGSLNVSNHVNIGSAVVGLKGDVPTGASVKPTHAWEFRGGAAGDTSPVYDLVNGVSADPASADRDASGIVFDSSSSIMDVGNVSLQSAFTMEFYFYYDRKESGDNVLNILLDFIQFDDIKIQNGYGDANYIYLDDSTTSFYTTGQMVAGFVHLLISTESDGTATLYVNNVLDVSDDISFTPGDITNMKIGNIGSSAVGDYYNEFTLFYFRIWDGVALGSSEVGQLYSNRDTIESPVLHFQVNDQTPVSVTDAGLEVSGNLMVNNQDIVTLITNASTAASTWEISNNALYNIDFNNNVGIGTKTPSEALEVSGNAKVSEILSVGALLGNEDAPEVVDLYVGVYSGEYKFYTNSGGTVLFDSPYTLDLNKSYRFTGLSDTNSNPFFISDNYDSGAYQEESAAIDISGSGTWGAGINENQSFTLTFGSFTVADSLRYYNTQVHTMDGVFTLQGVAGRVLDVSGHMGVTGNVSIGKENPSGHKALDVSGDVVIDGALDVNQTLLAKGNLEVNGNVTMAGGTAHRIDGGNMTISGGDLTIDNGTLTIKMGGNLVIEDPDISYTDLKTVVKISDQLDISNEGTGPAVKVNQMGDEDIAVFQDDGTNVFVIKDDGDTEMQGKLTVHNDVSMSGTLTVNNQNIVQVIEGANTWQKHANETDIYNKNSGNVGIGTTSPDYALDVSGDVNATGDVSANTVSATGAVSANTVSATTTVSANAVSATGTVSANAVNATTFSSTGALTVGGDVGISGDLEVDGGLALPQYDVEVKGKYTAASVEPTYAWEFRNATGTSVVYDMVGGVAATPQSGATSTSAGMTFNGSSDYVRVPSLTLGGSNRITIEIYYNRSDATISRTGLISFLGTSDSFNVYDEGDKINLINLGVDIGTAGSIGYADNTTNHIVISYDAGSVNLYINGQSNSYSASTSLLSSSITFNIETNIGRAIIASGTSAVSDSKEFPGTISFVRIWDGTALSASDVGALYADRNRVFNGPQLDFHVNNQLSLAITDNGLALPQYDVEMKGGPRIRIKGIRLYRKRAVSAAPGGAADTVTNAKEIQYWINDVNVAGSSNGGVVSTNLTDFDAGHVVTNINDGSVDTAFHSGDGVFGSIGEYIEIQFSKSHAITDTQAVVLYAHGFTGNSRLQGYVFQFLNESNETILETDEINPYDLFQTGSEYYVLTGPKYDSATTTSTKSDGMNAIWDGTGETGGVVTIDLAILPQLDFHVNNQLSLAITENGLALPQYDVEVKGNELACTKPTYAWEFRNNTSTNTVYDLVGGVAATPSGTANSTSEGMIFDGDHPTEVHLSLPSVIGGTTTIETYVRWDGTGADTQERIFDFRDTIFHLTKFSGGNNSLQIYLDGVARLTTYQFTAGGGLTHIVLTHDFDSSTTIVYVDNDVVFTLTSYQIDRVSRTTGYFLGGDPDRTDRNWEGIISYFRVYDGTALSASEVEFLYNTRETKYTEHDFRKFDIPQLDFHVNNQLSLAITENGLALPQYDVEVKGNELACTKPTYAWEFRNNTSTNTVYDLVGGLAATPVSTGSESTPTSTNAGMQISDGEAVGVTLGLNGKSIGGTMTIETYVTSDGDTGEDQRIFDFGPNNNRFSASKYADTKRIRIMNRNPGTSATNGEFITSNNYIPNNTLTHLVFSLAGATLNVYVDGTKTETQDEVSFPSLSSRTQTILGHNFNYTGSRGFNGTISFFRIWQGTALSASEVEFLYNTRETKYTQSDFRLFHPDRLDFHVNNQLSLAVTDNGLAMPQYDVEMKGKYTAASIEPTYAWEFRNATGTSPVYDMVSGVAATPSGATSTSAGMVFARDDYATVSNTDNFGGGDFSIEFLASVDLLEGAASGQVAYPKLFKMVFGSTTIFLYANVGGTDVRFKVNSTELTDSTETNLDWLSDMRHYTICYYHSSSSADVYVNGELSNKTGNTVAISQGTLSTFLISHAGGTGGNEDHEGTIAFFRIWNGTALSASDVTALYANRNIVNSSQLQIHSNNELALGITQNTLSMPRYNLVMEAKNNVGVAISTQPSYAWEFRDATGSAVVYDWVSGLAATMYGTAHSTNEGLVLDGDEDYAMLTPWLIDAESFSVEMYVKYDSLGNFARIFDFGSGAPSGNVYVSNYNAGAQVRFQIMHGTGGTHWRVGETDTYIGTGTNFFVVGEWIHVVATCDGDDSSATMKLYQNGTLAFNAVSGKAPESATRTTHYLGKSNYTSSSDNELDGTIAYFRWWQGTALSASEVATLYSNRENKESFNFNVRGKSALSVAQGKAEVAGTLSVGGNVGIGVTSPGYPLHVDGTQATGSSLGGTYYRITTNAYANQSADRPLMCNIEGRTGVSELVVYSDERIKKNIVDLSDNEALETLRLIEPKKYEYVDQILRTNNTVYGYIAQQIKEVLPYAVQEIRNKVVPNVYSYADISSEIVYTEASDISAVSTVGISTIYVDVSNVNTSAEVSMNVVMVEQSDISQNAVFSEAELEDGTKVHKLTFNDGYNTASLHESSNILRVMDASNQEYHITITNIETSYRLEIEEDLSGLVNAQGELFVAGQRVPQNVYKLVFSAFDTATLDASSTTLKLVDASDVTQYVSIASVLDSSTLQVDDDLQYMVPDGSNQLFVYGQKVSKSLTSLTFDGSYNVSSISSNAVSLKVVDANAQEQYVNVHTKESNRLLLDEDISGKISYGASGELFVQGQKIQSTKHILTIQNYDTANLDASSTNLCLYDYNNDKHEVSIVSVIDGSNVEISQDPTSFAHEGQVFVYGQKVNDFHTLSKEYINVVTLSAVQELDRALTKVTQEKDELQTKYDVLETKYDALEARVLALEGASST